MVYEYINKKELFFLSENTAPIDYPMHIHQMLEIVHMLKGNITMGINQTQYSLQTGDIAVIFPNIIHSYFTPPHTYFSGGSYEFSRDKYLS